MSFDALIGNLKLPPKPAGGAGGGERRKARSGGLPVRRLSAEDRRVLSRANDVRRRLRSGLIRLEDTEAEPLATGGGEGAEGAEPARKRARGEAEAEAAAEGTPGAAAGAAAGASDAPDGADASPAMLVLCFLIIDDLPLEALWRQWLAQHERLTAAAADAVRVRVLVHAKFPERVASPWVRRRLLPYSHRPEWGSVQIAQAMWDLAAEASALDGFGDRSAVAYLSESCFPICPLQAALPRLSLRGPGPARSVLAAYQRPCNGYANQYQFAPLRNDGGDEGPLPRSCVWKADQWVSLGGRDVHNVVRLPAPRHLGARPWRFFGRKAVRASDELLLPICLAVAGALGPEHAAQAAPPLPAAGTLCGDKTYEELLPPEEEERGSGGGGGGAPAGPARRGRITYALWKGAKSPETFADVDVERFRTAAADAADGGGGCVFARKLRPPAGRRVGEIGGATGDVALDALPTLEHKWCQVLGFTSWIAQAPEEAEEEPAEEEPAEPGEGSEAGRPAAAPPATRYTVAWWDGYFRRRQQQQQQQRQRQQQHQQHHQHGQQRHRDHHHQRRPQQQHPQRGKRGPDHR